MGQALFRSNENDVKPKSPDEVNQESFFEEIDYKSFFEDDEEGDGSNEYPHMPSSSSSNEYPPLVSSSDDVDWEAKDAKNNLPITIVSTDNAIAFLFNSRIWVRGNDRFTQIPNQKYNLNFGKEKEKMVFEHGERKLVNLEFALVFHSRIYIPICGLRMKLFNFISHYFNFFERHFFLSLSECIGVVNLANHKVKRGFYVIANVKLKSHVLKK